MLLIVLPLPNCFENRIVLCSSLIFQEELRCLIVDVWCYLFGWCHSIDRIQIKAYNNKKTNEVLMQINALNMRILAYACGFARVILEFENHISNSIYNICWLSLVGFWRTTKTITLQINKSLQHVNSFIEEHFRFITFVGNGSYISTTILKKKL